MQPDKHRNDSTANQPTVESSRREFIKASAAAASAIPVLSSVASSQDATGVQVTSFATADSLVHGPEWESINPGYWKVSGGSLRRRLTNVGDRARRTGFPFHYLNRGQKMETEYDPSLPAGIIHLREWDLRGSYALTATMTVKALRPDAPEADSPDWKMYQDGYGLMGIALGSKSLLESYSNIRNSIQVVYRDDGKFAVLLPTNRNQKSAKGSTSFVDAPTLAPGDLVTISVVVSATGGNSVLEATLTSPRGIAKISVPLKERATQGRCGIIGRGLLDFEVGEYKVDPMGNHPLNVAVADCFACYALGDTLKQVNGKWQVRFVGLFASDGTTAEVRIADSATPLGGWENVPVAGSAEIVNNDWRRNTATVEATLPANPGEQTLYYTAWKDGVDVTADPRIGTNACGPGTGFVGDVPSSGTYVGRLPQLKAPYKVCGLSCHAINWGLQQRNGDGFKISGHGDDWQYRDQPTVEAYKHLDDYNFQVMLWEDDVWYMELVMYPPSTDDAYKIVTQSICGPTSRWQLMRHWNIINPGDHDHGMDDVKGPEQIAIRVHANLGQDNTYMQRNFKIVHHLVTGDADLDPLSNPKRWRAWKMPNQDFTMVVLDSRLWRSSQDTDMWDDAGWSEFKNLYDRTDPTRSLLGEEQFGWLQELLATDSSRLICLTGINGMHTVWGGEKNKGQFADDVFDQRDRVTADYAGWVKAGADRVLELLGSRDGVISVYGDVHNGCIMKNTNHNVIECSFGPIGRSGGRRVIPNFGPIMKDYDGRELEVYSLYHKTHANVDLDAHPKDAPFYWNFLEMQFDTDTVDPGIELRVRNLIDPPSETPRGGGTLETQASKTGRTITSRLPMIRTLANADVRFVTASGNAIRATRSLPDGTVSLKGLIDVEAGTQIIVTSFDGSKSESVVVVTEDV